MLKQQHQLFVGLLAAADAAVIAGAAAAAWAGRMALCPPHDDWWPYAWEQYARGFLVLYTVPVALASLRWFGLYLPRRDRSPLSEVPTILKASIGAMLSVLALLYVFDSAIFAPLDPDKHGHKLAAGGYQLDPRRVHLGLLTLLLPLFLCLHRISFRVVLREMRKLGWNQRHVAIIGCGRLGQIVCGTLERNSWTGIKVAYFLSHQDRTRRVECRDHPVLGGLDELERVMEERKPDAVYIALPATRAVELAGLLARLDRFAVDVRVVPDITPRYLPQSMTVGEIDGMPVLSYRECPTSGVGGLSKRALDVLGSCAALLLFSPIMLAVAAVVRLEGPGPVIFKQRRVSLGGQVFDIYKFRTMFHAADEAAEAALAGSSGVAAVAAGGAGKGGVGTGMDRWTKPNDPRITPLGRWLRRTSLDELPQLFNVLTGEMSLVGPRPERPELIERFRDDWRGYMLRQHVKAGMTGWAQVNGHRGNTSLRKRLQYDLFYVKNWSLGFDLKILFFTLFRGFVHRNAH